MNFYEFVTAIVAIGGSFAFVLALVKIGTQHNLRIEKIKHGYPLDDEPARERGYDGGGEYAAERLQ